jgi:serine/threonine-protein kinase
MSPEQCRGHGKIDWRSDVYSLGCIIFEMITGHPPFRGSGYGEVLAQHIYEPPPTLRAFDPTIPEVVDDVVKRTLVKDPEKRLQSMDELYQALDHYLLSQSASHAGPLPAPPVNDRSGAVTIPAGGQVSGPVVTEPRITTLRGSTGQVTDAGAGPTGLAKKSKAAIFLVAGGVAAAIGVIAVVASGGGGGGGSDPTSLAQPGFMAQGQKPEPEAPKPEAEAPKPTAEPEAPRPTAEPEAPKPEPEAPKPTAEAPKPTAEPEAPKPTAEPPKPTAEAPKPTAEAPKPTPVAATPEAPKPVIPAPPPAPVQIKVALRSEPSGAEVLRGGKVVGKTPFTKELDAGTGKLAYTLRLAGHKDATAELPADKGGEATVKLAAEPAVQEPARPTGKKTKPVKDGVVNPFK